MGEVTSKDGVQMAKATYEYSDKKVVRKKTISEKTQFNGRREIVFEYDDAGLMTLKNNANFNSDGLIEAYGHQKYSYDQQNRLIEINDRFSFPKGSSLESKIIFEFNNNGNLLKEVSQSKGLIPKESSNEYVYIYNECVNQ